MITFGMFVVMSFMAGYLLDPMTGFLSFLAFVIGYFEGVHIASGRLF